MVLCISYRVRDERDKENLRLLASAFHSERYRLFHQLPGRYSSAILNLHHDCLVTRETLVTRPVAKEAAYFMAPETPVIPRSSSAYHAKVAESALYVEGGRNMLMRSTKLNKHNE